MAEEIIQARLWTKVDTLDNWNNNPLLLGPGELALVTNSQGVPMNMKWGDKTTRKSFSELPFAIAYDQGQFVAITGTVLPPSTASKVRYSLVGEGTYTRAGMTSIVVPTGKMGVIVDDGTTWTLGSTVTLPQAQADGVVAPSNTKATSGDTVYNALKPVNSVIAPSKNIINYLDFKGETWVVSATPPNPVVAQSSANWISIHITSGFTPGKQYTPQGLGPLGGSTNPWVIFADASNNHISTILVSSFGTFTVPAGTVHIYMRIANVVGIGNTPTNNAYVNTAMLSEGTVERPFEKYGQASVKAATIVDDYSPFYVDLIPVTTPYTNVYQTQEVGRVYERMRDNIYVCYSLRYERLDYADGVSGNFHGGKIVRFAGAKLVTYDLVTNTFTDMANQTLIITPESEWVMSSAGWTGGYHGNEDYSKVQFIIDNKVYNTTGDVDFTATGIKACKSFSYIQQSNLKSDVGKTSIADRKKVVVFSNGYKVNSKINPTVTGRSMAMYAGICCVSKTFTQVVSDSGIVVNPAGGEVFVIDNDFFARKLDYTSPIAKLSVQARVFDWAKEAVSYLRLWDRATDTKYYLYLPPFNSVIGGWVETEMEVNIYV